MSLPFTYKTILISIHIYSLHQVSLELVMVPQNQNLQAPRCLESLKSLQLLESLAVHSQRQIPVNAFFMTDLFYPLCP